MVPHCLCIWFLITSIHISIITGLPVLKELLFLSFRVMAWLLSSAPIKKASIFCLAAWAKSCLFNRISKSSALALLCSIVSGFGLGSCGGCGVVSACGGYSSFRGPIVTCESSILGFGIVAVSAFVSVLVAAPGATEPFLFVFILSVIE
jgi:hypothetical protein